MKTLDKVIDHFGNISATARGLGIKDRQVVQHWVRQGRIPYKWGMPIQAATKSAITASEVWIAASKAGR